jgi:hypothetical protein
MAVLVTSATRQKRAGDKPRPVASTGGPRGRFQKGEVGLGFHGQVRLDLSWPKTGLVLNEHIDEPGDVVFRHARFCFPDTATVDASCNRFGGECLTHAATSSAAPAVKQIDHSGPKRRVRAIQYGRR